VREAATDTNALERATDTFDKKKQKPYGERIDARNALRDAARSLLERIMNVDERPR
jgi:hypothetical protein